MGLLERLLAPFLDRLRQLFKPFDKVINLITKFFHNVTHLRENVQTLADTVKSEINEWKNFRENIAFRTRVINVKSAVENIEDFWDEIRGAWSAITDLWSQLRNSFRGGESDPAADAREAVADIENSGFRGIIEKAPKLVKGFEKALGFVALLADGLEHMVSFVDDLTTIVNALRDIRRNVETGESLFLPQSNKRRTETLSDGSKIKIRVGSLHQ